MGILIAFFALIAMALSRNSEMGFNASFDLYLDKFVMVNGIANWILIGLLALVIILFIVGAKWLGWDFAMPVFFTGTCGMFLLGGWVVGRIIVTVFASQLANAWTATGAADPVGFVILLVICVIPMLYGA